MTEDNIQAHVELTQAQAASNTPWQFNPKVTQKEVQEAIDFLAKTKINMVGIAASVGAMEPIQADADDVQAEATPQTEAAEAPEPLPSEKTVVRKPKRDNGNSA